MQTDTPVYGTNKKARIAASEVSTHARTNRHRGIFINPSSCGRHDKEVTRVSVWSVSQRSESAVTQPRPCLAPRSSQARSGPTVRTCTFTPSPVATPQYVRKRLFSRLYNSQPPTLKAQWRQTSPARCLTLPRLFIYTYIYIYVSENPLFLFLLFRSNTRRNMRKTKRSPTIIHSPRQTIPSSGSSDTLAPSSVM